jgi:hypothetical protein
VLGLSPLSASRDSKAPAPFITLGTAVAIGVVVAASIASAMFGLSKGEQVASVAGGLVFVGIAVGCLGAAERRSRFAVALVLAALAVVGCAVIWVSRGGAALIVMPLISSVVLYRSTRQAIASSAGLVAWVVLTGLHFGSRGA